MILGEELFVANSAAAEISLYNSRDNSLIGTIEVNNGPSHFVKDQEGDLWVISTGAYISGGAIQRINPGNMEVVKTIDLTAFSPNGRIGIDRIGQNIYFLGEQWAADFSYTETAIYHMQVNDNNPIEELLAGRNFYGLGVDPEDNILYVSDHHGLSI